MVRWSQKERSLPLTKLEENRGAAEAVGVVAVAVAVLQQQQQQQAQRERLVEGDQVLPHEAGVRQGSRGSPKQDGLYWIERSKSAKRWPPWRQNRVVIPLENVCC